MSIQKLIQTYWPYVKISGMVIIPIVLLILPADFFDNGPPICLSRVFLGMECYGCGMTRGVMHLMHFQWEEAYLFNKLSFIVLPGIAYYWIKEIAEDWKKIRKLS